MCGRYATTRSSTELSALFEAYDDTGGRLGVDYNVAPTDPVPIIRTAAQPAGMAGPDAGRVDDAAGGRADAPGGARVEEGLGRRERLLSVARWGLVPAWASDTRSGARMINARAETVATSRAYASSFARRRCLVPADGWYEWLRRDSVASRDTGTGRGGAAGRAVPEKQPYYLTRADGGVLTFAGIWSIWSGGGGEPLVTCSVITTAALGDLALVHDRMPLLLPPRRWAAWLAGGGEPAELLAPPAEEALAAIEIRPVGRAVGDVRNDGPELVARVPAPPLGAPPEGSDALMLF